MEAAVEDYLTAVEGQLKLMPSAERSSVLGEVKSRIEECLYFGNAPVNEVLLTLGEPKTLAALYLEEAIKKSSGMNLTKLLMMISFYSKTDRGSTIIILALSVLSFVLVVTGIIIPIFGLIETSGFFFGSNETVDPLTIGGIETHPLLLFPMALVGGLLFIIGGRVSWKLLKQYAKKVGDE